MLAATAAVTMRRRTSSADIETMRGARLEAEEAPHYRLPLAAMRASSLPFLEMKYQPVRHFVGYYLDHEGQAILLEQHRVEAQPPAAQVRLPGRLAAQVKPDARSRQAGMELATEPPGGLDPRVKRSMQGPGIEPVEPVGIRGGEHGSGHGVVECSVSEEA